MSETNIPAAIAAPSLIERWENCERVLASMTEHERQHHWDMSEWGKQTECGTVACAAGTCGLDPWFRARGFTLNFKPNGYSDITDVAGFFGFEGSERIFFNPQRRSVETVLDEVRAYLAELRKLEELTAGLQLPAVGAEWPEQGGIFAGARLGVEGAPAYLLIVGPEHDNWLTWDAAKKWAADLVVGPHQDFTLPDCNDGIVLFDRVRPLFEPTAYWLSEQHADLSVYAWYQGFGNGVQRHWRKDDNGRARAVRRSII